MWRHNNIAYPSFESELRLTTLRRRGDSRGYGADRAEIAGAVEHERVHPYLVTADLRCGKPLPVALPRC